MVACLLFGLVAVSCHKEDENELKSVSKHGTVDLNGASASGLSVLSPCGESDVSNGGFDVDMPKDATLDVIMVNNAAGDVVMLYRGKYNEAIAINSQSTAIALVTLHPFFAQISLDDYEQLRSIVISQESFSALVQEVERSVARMNPIYDTTNGELRSVLEDVIIDVVQYLGQEKALKSGSKNTIFGQNCDPLDVRNEWKDVLTFREEGLWPSYFGSAKAPSGRTTDLRVFTRDDIGITDIMFNTSIYGSSEEYQASEVGTHVITLSCNNALGKMDFYMHVASEFLSIVGFSMESGGVATRSWINMTMDGLASQMSDGLSRDDDFHDAWAYGSVIWSLIVEYFKENPGTFIGKFVGNLNAIKKFYDGFKTMFNGFPRVKKYIMAPATITLTVERDASGELSAGGGSTGDDWVDLGLPSGLLWATRNVGATSPEDYGDYFAWGETSPKDFYDWSTYSYCYEGQSNQLTKYCDEYWGYNGFADNLTILQPGDDAATANYSGGARTPTTEEWGELMHYTTDSWTTQNGVNGRLFTATNGNSIFLPATGWRSNSSLSGDGSYGLYWSSLRSTVFPRRAERLEFNSNSSVRSSQYRDFGHSVRAVRQN